MTAIRHGFTMWKKKGVRYLVVPAFEAAGGVTCAVSTRVGGVSPKPYDKLNFSRSRENNEENYQENMRRFAMAAGFDAQRAIASRYEHGNVFYHAEGKDAGRGVVLEELSQFCDGLYTSEMNLPLITYHADCVPLIFYDPIIRSVAICHAGWRGVAGHIVREAITAMQTAGSSAGDILAAVGPCISVKHFEVQNDVRDIYTNAFGDEVIELRGGRVFVDLPKACAKDMLGSGLNPGNITLSDICTYDNKRLFYSHRRDKGRTGAMAAVIALKE